MKELSIIIPCYNESGSLPNLIEVCRESCKDTNDVEFIFVNNGSTDNSKYVFSQLLSLPENSFATIVDVPINKGYGYGILQGLYIAKGRILSWTHADLQTSPVDVILAFESYRENLINGNSIVKGRRIHRNILDNLFTLGMSFISSLLLSVRLSDINAQPKIFHRNFLAMLERAPHDFSIDLFLLYQARIEKINIETYAVRFEKRKYGKAKGGGSLRGKLELIKRTFNYILELRKNIKLGTR